MASYSDENIHICGLEEPDILAMDTVLYYGFGGYTVRKNGKLFYEGDPDDKWENFKKMQEIEIEAQKEPKAKWEVELAEPLCGAIWKRRKDGVWVATEKNIGFA